MSTDNNREVPSISIEHKEKVLNTYSRWSKKYGIPLLTGLLIALIVRWLVLTPYYIPSQSMEPRLKINDIIVVNKILYNYTNPSRGDIVVFYYPPDPYKKVKYIKRIIGLSGETLSIKNNKVYINGKAIYEPYIESTLTYNDFGPVEIPKGMYFVMGDNRNNSLDSRKWGLLDEKLIIGKAILVFWPLKRIAII